MTTITVTIWHNAAVDCQGHPTGMLEGYQPGDPVVRVFTYQAGPAGRLAEDIAEEAFAICNGHPRDARGADLAQQYYQRGLRSLSVGDVVAVGEAGLAVGRVGWSLVGGGLNEVRTSAYGTRPLPASAPGGAPPAKPSTDSPEGAEPAMSALESADYQVARGQIKGNPIIRQMAAGVAAVALAELAHEDGTPRFAFMQRANRAFDTAQARSAGNPSYQAYPADAPRHIGLIAEAVLAERAAIREAVASAVAAPGTSPESGEVTRIIERMRAGELPSAIAGERGVPR